MIIKLVLFCTGPKCEYCTVARFEVLLIPVKIFGNLCNFHVKRSLYGFGSYYIDVNEERKWLQIESDFNTQLKCTSCTAERNNAKKNERVNQDVT